MSEGERSPEAADRPDAGTRSRLDRLAKRAALALVWEPSGAGASSMMSAPTQGAPQRRVWCRRVNTSCTLSPAGTGSATAGQKEGSSTSRSTLT